MFFHQPKYVPAFSTRAAESRAFRELSSEVLDGILPLVTLTRDGKATSFDAALEGVLAVADGRPVIIDFDPSPRDVMSEQAFRRKIEDINAVRADEGKAPRVDSPKQAARYAREREATREFNRSLGLMLDATHGLRNWVEFALKHDNVIPAFHLTDVDQVRQQVRLLEAAGRPMAFRVYPRDQTALAKLTVVLRGVADLRQVVLVLDAGNIRGHEAVAFDAMIDALSLVRSGIEGAAVVRTVCMAGSFPKSLADFLPGEVTDDVFPLSIEERHLFRKVSARFPDVIYGDHAAVQPRSDQAGGNGFYAHVELVHRNVWHVCRSTQKSTGDAYQHCAHRIVSEVEVWRGRSVSWGTDMVSRASRGLLTDGAEPPASFRGPGPWVGPRVNQHITVQALLGAGWI